MQEVKVVTAFGCCAFWQTCKLGTETCVYEVSNPAKQQACGTFKRAKRAASCTNVHETVEVDQSHQLIERKTFETDEDGQLSLF